MGKAPTGNIKLVRFEIDESPDILAFEVRVDGDPVLFNAGVGETYVSSGDTVTIHYQAQGSPRAEISGWYWIEGEKHPLFSEVLTSSGRMIGLRRLRVPSEPSA